MICSRKHSSGFKASILIETHRFSRRWTPSPPEEASRPVSATCASLAAQVDHVRYYLQVLLETGLLGQRADEIDWEASWQIESLTAEEWAALKRELKGTHQRVLSAIRSHQNWVGEDDFGVSLAILAHTAYHLGEIRQALCVIK